mgnify:CR=1 FL=1
MLNCGRVVAEEAWIVDMYEPLRWIQAWYQQALNMLPIKKKKSSAQRGDVIDGVKQVATTILLPPVHASDDQSGACAPLTEK